MATYKKSNGLEIDTNSMADSYLKNALNKAIVNGDDANIKACQEEMDLRGLTNNSDANA